MSDVEQPIPPHPRPDTLAGAVLISLSRPLGTIFSWSVVRTFVIGALSFGIVPLFAFSKRLRHSSSLERSQLWHLAEWMRVNCGEEAAPLVKSAENVRIYPVLNVLPPVCGLVALLALATTFLHFELSFTDALNATYQYFPASANDMAPAWADNVFAVWAFSLSLGYASLWLAMQMQHNAVRRYVRVFSLFASRNGASPVPVPPPVLGLRPLWLIGGIVLAMGGAVWAIPMMLAGAAQRRYTKRIGGAMRAELAQRVREIMQTQHPDRRVPMPVTLLRTCRAQLCGAKLPPGAKFCPRCGTACEVAMVA
ncbi:MAG TPA: zinc ribbon domain-containing protein [Tepidisphaeraceae bacterium]|nr:zinc ribbon domain-containing protein [Tepidisphaeraceae bacterium]